jgi:hypothetical protein
MCKHINNEKHLSIRRGAYCYPYDFHVFIRSYREHF